MTPSIKTYSNKLKKIYRSKPNTITNVQLLAKSCLIFLNMSTRGNSLDIQLAA